MVQCWPRLPAHKIALWRTFVGTYIELMGTENEEEGQKALVELCKLLGHCIGEGSLKELLRTTHGFDALKRLETQLMLP